MLVYRFSRSVKVIMIWLDQFTIKKTGPDAISDFTIWINWLKIWFAKIVFFYIITLIKN